MPGRFGEDFSQAQLLATKENDQWTFCTWIFQLQNVCFFISESSQKGKHLYTVGRSPPSPEKERKSCLRARAREVTRPSKGL